MTDRLEDGTRDHYESDTTDALRLTARDAAAALDVADIPPPALPVSLTPFIGRRQEIATAGALIGRDDVRLLTLTGPGGVGKTRLSMRLAEEVIGEFADGVIFVSLSSIVDSDSVAPTIARTIGVQVSVDEPLSDRLCQFFGDKRILLLLDNFEQVADAAPLLTDLLSRCPKMKIIVSSRMRLRLSGEHVFMVPPLDLPGIGPLPALDIILANDAVQLFVDRAEASLSTFTLTSANAPAVVAICRHLDGLPLAIELAAARINVFSVDTLHMRLEERLALLSDGPADQPLRLRSMRDSIAWSYDLLDSGEKIFFCRLAIFVGGWTLDAAEVVAWTEDERGRGSVLDQVTSLVSKHLARLDERSDNGSRYGMLETVRQFALEELMLSGEAEEIRERHAAWCLEFAERAETARTTPGSSLLADRLGAERANLRAALSRLRDQGKVIDGLRLAGALWPLWLERGEIAEGREHLETFLAFPDAAAQPQVWARAMCVAGELAQAQGDHDRAVELSQQAHKVFQEIGDDRGTAAALNTLGLDALVQGDYSNAAMLLEDSLERFRSVGDARASSWSLRHLSSLAFRRGDVVQCTVLAEEGLRIAQAAGNRLDIARFLLNLSNAAVTLGRLDQAQAQAEECLALFRESGDRWGVAVALERLGHAAFERGDAVQALALLETSLEMFREIGDPEGTALVLMRLGWLERPQGRGATETKRFMEGMAIARERRLSSLIAWTQLGQGAVALDRGNVADAARAWRESLALAAGVQDHVATATVLDWSAHLAFAGNAAAGARVIGAVCALRDTLEVPKQASMRASHERLYDALQATLGTGEYTSHVRAGADLSLDAAIAEANEILSLAMSRAQAESPIGVHEASRSAQPGSPTKAPAGLSSREVEVLRLVVQGYSDQDIATALFISRRTASTHVQHIFNKLGVSSRAAAAAWAVHNGLA